MSICCVPNFKTGFKSCKGKFAALLAAWKWKIPREVSGDFNLSAKTRVCEQHFKDTDVIRYDEFVINGKVEKIKRLRPKLRPGALPTIFPNLPKYLSSQTKARKSPKNVNCQKKKS